MAAIAIVSAPTWTDGAFCNGLWWPQHRPYHRPFLACTSINLMQGNLKAFEDEGFCPSITDHLHSLRALNDASTHPAVRWNLRSARLIRAGLRDAVHALPMSERTPQGFTSCVNKFMSPIELGYSRARGEQEGPS